MVPIWFQILQACALVGVAAFGIWIAFQQWHTAHEELRLNLFDRRLTVFICARKFIDDVQNVESPVTKSFAELWRARDTANFLFGPEIVELLKKINDDAFGMRTSIRQLKTATGKKRHDLEEKNSAHLSELLKVQSALPTHFADYMSFSAIKGRVGKP